MPINHSFGINHDLIGNRAEPIACLSVLVAISHDPLAALLKFNELIAKGLHRSHTIRDEHTSLEINTLYILVVLGHLYCAKHLVKTQGCHLAS